MTGLVEVQTSELTGPALDWAVAQVEGRKIEIVRGGTYGIENSLWFIASEGGQAYSPSKDWVLGGPLLDKHCTSFGVLQNCTGPRWRSFAYSASTGMSRLAGGESILIAACRAIVILNIGDTVRVPKELV